MNPRQHGPSSAALGPGLRPFHPAGTARAKTGARSKSTLVPRLCLPSFNLGRGRLGPALLALFLGCGCQATSTSKPSDSPHARDRTAGVAACRKLRAALCDAAGPESPTCDSIRLGTQLLSPDACTAALDDLEYSTGRLKELSGKCERVVSKLCGAVGDKTDTCAMVREQVGMLPIDRCEDLLANEAAVLAEVRQVHAASQPLSQELQAALVAGPAPAFGPETAPVKVVEFSDFECPFCARAAATVHAIRARYDSEVRFVFRQFPLAMHPRARPAALASLAAHAQGKFWAYHDELFANQAGLDGDSLEKYAVKVGLDLAAFRSALEEPVLMAQLDADLALGEQVRVEGTPTLFINGKRAPDPGDQAAVIQMIETALDGS